MKKIIKNFVAFRLLEGLAISFFFGTYVLFLRQKGLDLLEISLLNGFYMIAVFFFEIPTGAIADFFGRKISVVTGLFVYSFSFLIYFYSNSFWYFVLAEIIGAGAGACISGSFDALIVDSLKYHGHSGSFEKIFSRGELRVIGVALGSFLGGLIGSVDLSYPWLASAIGFFLLAFFVIYFFKEEYFVKPDRKDINFRAIIKNAKESLRYGFKNRDLMFMVLFLGFLALVFQSLNMYWPFILKDNFSVKNSNMGMVFALIAISSYFGSRFASIFSKKIKNKKSAIILSQVITLIGIFAACLFLRLPVFLIFFILHEFGRGILEPLSKAYINEKIDNKNRATVLSLNSMVLGLGAGIGLFISGLIAKNFGELNSWKVSAIILAVIIIIFWKKR